ncbi:MAG: tetratricopeptide repeat protein [Magnetococcales bacterium]|nr:tetratricopeptide repeat protein [Magnetococcales bacterium]
MTESGDRGGLATMMRLLLFTSLFVAWGSWIQDIEAANLHSPAAVLAYACGLEAQGDHGRAATEFGRYLAFARQEPTAELPRLEEAMYRLADNLAQAGESDAALRAFAALGERFPGSRFIPRALLGMGYVYERSGATTEARQRYEKLLGMETDPEAAALAALRLAWLSLAQPGDEAMARRYLHAVVHAAQGEKAGETLQEYAGDAREMLQEVEALPRLPYKDPWLAGTLSAVLPGAGHLYLERPQDAGLVLASNGLLLLGTAQAFAKGISGLGVALAVVELGWYSGTVFSAVSLTHRYNQQLRHEHLNSLGAILDLDSRAAGVKMTWRY